VNILLASGLASRKSAKISSNRQEVFNRYEKAERGKGGVILVKKLTKARVFNSFLVWYE